MSGRKARAEYRIPRSFSVLLAVCILLCAKAFDSARAEASAWALLQKTIDQAEAGKIITLTEDVIATPEDTRLTVPSGKWITLDLNGYSLDRDLNGVQDKVKPDGGICLRPHFDAISSDFCCPGRQIMVF